MARCLRRVIVDILIAAAILIVDRLVKEAALVYLTPGVPIQVGSVVGIDLWWTLTYNQGAAWGLCGGMPSMLLFFRVVFIAFLVVLYFRAQMSDLLRTALSVIIAGAVGNIIDTIVWGHVVDMIHVRLWGWDYPVFNVADMAICIGSGAVVWCTLFSQKRAI